MFHRVKPENSEQENHKQRQTAAPVEQDDTSAADEQALEDDEEAVETDQDEDQDALDQDTLSSTDDEETSQNEKETPSMNTLVQQNRTAEADHVTNEFYNDAPAGYQQRAAQIPASYSSYTAPTAPVAPSAPSASYDKPSRALDVSAGRTLTVGVGINMSGEIDSCDHLVVEGTVEAALKGASVLDIAESGTFFGSVEIEEATIAGRFEGEIVVHGRLTIRSGGVITGSISYKELEVEAGAVLDGRITPVREQNRQSQPAEKVQAGRQASQMAKAKPATNAKQNAANAEGSLFVAAK